MLSEEQKIKAFAVLGKYILSNSPELTQAVNTASLHNKWFTPDNVRHALRAIAGTYLDENLLRKWLSNYPAQTTNNEQRTTKRIALIMAGNIPLAGFHDLLCVLITGNFALVKQSSKDKHLLPHLLSKLCETEPLFEKTFEFTEQMKNFDAVIATGSNNSSRYFEYYFGKYPHIIRKNRNSVAVLTGKETKDELLRLGDDIFLYFGLGCRSVSKLYVPHEYNFSIFFTALQPFQTLLTHNGYKNNYDYHLTLHIMNKTAYLASDLFILQESKSLPSPIASLNFEYYNSMDELHATLEPLKSEIQRVVGNDFAVAFGESQHPQLMDYADGMDTIEFLNGQRM